MNNLAKELKDWLHTRNTDQWARPWPTAEEHDERIRRNLAANATWILWDGAVAAATITVHGEGNAALWTGAERREPAVYLHRIMVSRYYAGQRIGARLIDWAAARAAAEYGARQARIDVWTDNTALHAYYTTIGFTFLRLADCRPDYPSRALFQRPIAVADPPGAPCDR
ncbi:MAG: hypothetical protein AUI10_12600 [Actinobacteria bacterium 13_2_20CM_2_72_6]|nr:MAG: hypothetical protein AUI10_12600 [Actinobacteria bacterium 13_2_20CM_2_72_6]